MEIKTSTETNAVLQVKQTAQDCYVQQDGVNQQHEHMAVSEQWHSITLNPRFIPHTFLQLSL